MRSLPRVCLAAVLCLLSTVSVAEDQAAGAPSSRATETAMQAMEAELRVGKRALVGEQLQLTAQEADAFWPLYDAYQSALTDFNQRRLAIILKYAEVYNAGTLQDAAALDLSRQALRLERDEAAHMERAFREISKILPGVKAARYLQVEAKIRALVRYEQAAQIPFAR